MFYTHGFSSQVGWYYYARVFTAAHLLARHPHKLFYNVQRRGNHDSWGFIMRRGKKKYTKREMAEELIFISFAEFFFVCLLTIRLLFMALVTHITAAIWSLTYIKKELRFKFIFTFYIISCINLTNIFHKQRTISSPHMPHIIFVYFVFARVCVCVCSEKSNKICISWRKLLFGVKILHTHKSTTLRICFVDFHMCDTLLMTL